jgi:hypothetical protein
MAVLLLDLYLVFNHGVCVCVGGGVHMCVCAMQILPKCKTVHGCSVVNRLQLTQMWSLFLDF